MSKRDVTSAVGDFFDGYASDFDAIYGHSIRRSVVGSWIDRKFRRAMMMRFQETLTHTNEPTIKSILDVGCGPGRYTVAFALQGKEVVGVDLAEGMLTLAKDTVQKAGVASQVEFVEGDYMAIQLNRTFDAACLMGFFDYIPNPVPLLQKLATEVTGSLYASFPKAGGFLAWQRRVRYRLRDCPLWLYQRQDLEDILVASGFANKYEIKDFGREWYVSVRINE
jgi:SAM-dependent methyltransferase